MMYYTRRQSLKFVLAGVTLAGVTTPLLPVAWGTSESGKLLTKPIPSTLQPLPVIGLGTWRTFNVGSDPELINARAEVVRAFFDHQGGLIDSSPMYGSAPDFMGQALKRLGIAPSLFSAEKIWSPAGGSAAEQVSQLKQRWGVKHFNLIQVHNLTNWREYLPALRDLKAAGVLDYIGITTSHGRRHAEIEKIMMSEDIDFVQMTYNIAHRDVESRLLPLAQERGFAVIANRPYDGGNLIKDLKRRQPIPEWAAKEFNCRTWADFLLKFIVSHPAVNCAIPATTQVSHLKENMLAGHAPMPSARERQRMIQTITSL